MTYDEKVKRLKDLEMMPPVFANEQIDFLQRHIWDCKFRGWDSSIAQKQMDRIKRQVSISRL